jgi:N-acetylglucosamine-6-sulfatase
VKPRMLLILALLFGLGTIAASQPTLSYSSASKQPNFVVIVVDDLDLASVSRMPAVNRRLVASGTTFSRFFASTPLCCPSRASILRGQYAHNHRVLRNTGDDAGFAAFKATGAEDHTIASTLQGGGYETALIGKYLNGYAFPRDDIAYIPPGWDFWVAGVDHDAYNNVNYALNVNGEIVNHGSDERDYLTDVLAAHALDFLDTAAGLDRPFFLYLAPYAPHSPSTPAPRHEGMFAGETAPRGPAFNERNIQDKPDWVKTSRLSDERISRIDSMYRDRLESLMAVDEMVDVLVQRLADRNILSSTYILFLSDNGYFLGEHRQPHGKDAPYDAASRVPLIVRGPRIMEGATIEEIALNIDLFPTVADLAGVPAPSFVDGRSIVPLLTGNDVGWRQVVLIEGFGKETESNEGGETATPAFLALRSRDILYTEYETGERELYDLRNDPHQLSNVAQDAPNTLLREYSRRLKAISSCSGSECARWEDEPLSRRIRLESGKGDRTGAEKEQKTTARDRGTSRAHENRGKRSHRDRVDSEARGRRVTASGAREHAQSSVPEHRTGRDKREPRNTRGSTRRNA